MNKGIWAISIGVSFVAGMFFTQIIPAVQSADAISDTGSEQSQLGKLQSILKILSPAVKRIQSINVNFQPPPEDQKPDYLAALNSIITESNNLEATANDIKAQLGPP
jgi:hypothetical protein